MPAPFIKCAFFCPFYIFCGTMILYPVKICHLYWFNKMLIGHYPSRKYRWSDQTRRILGREKTQPVVTSQMQRKQDENISLSKEPSHVAKHR